MSDNLLEELFIKMDKVFYPLKDISTLRTGRLCNMLDAIKVDVYGSYTNWTIATVSVPEARLVSIQVWDKTINLIDAMKSLNWVLILKLMDK